MQEKIVRYLILKLLVNSGQNLDGIIFMKYIDRFAAIVLGKQEKAEIKLFKEVQNG